MTAVAEGLPTEQWTAQVGGTATGTVLSIAVVVFGGVLMTGVLVVVGAALRHEHTGAKRAKTVRNGAARWTGYLLVVVVVAGANLAMMNERLGTPPAEFGRAFGVEVVSWAAPPSAGDLDANLLGRVFGLGYPLQEDTPAFPTTEGASESVVVFHRGVQRTCEVKVADARWQVQCPPVAGPITRVQLGSPQRFEAAFGVRVVDHLPTAEAHSAEVRLFIDDLTVSCVVSVLDHQWSVTCPGPEDVPRALSVRTDALTDELVDQTRHTGVDRRDDSERAS